MSSHGSHPIFQTILSRFQKINIMKKYVIGMQRSALVLFGLAIASPSLQAQYFPYPGNGDLMASFRKEGAHQGTNELVVLLGNVTNFLTQAAGTTVTMNNIPPARLTDS